MRSVWEDLRSFKIIGFGEVVRVLTLEVLQTLKVRQFLCVGCKGDKTPEVL